MFALIDCHNFFVSCERVFRPDLENKPVIVLSSNDGCVIARSREVKDLGIPMGIPIFKVRHLIKEHNIHLFSSNFPLYGNLSTRVMNVLQTFVPHMEVYSVDEAFLDCRDLPENLEDFSKRIQTTVKQWTGIPVGVGIAPTKTLAKVATYFVKKRRFDSCILKDPNDIKEALSQTPIEEVWGVGRKSTQKLRMQGIYTALDLQRVDPRWMRKTFSVVGERLVRELQGVPCLPLEVEGEDRKSLQVTRSFGRPITQFLELKEAVLTYACRLGQKLRQNRQKAQMLSVYIRTSPFKEDYLCRSGVISLGQGVNDTPSLIKAAVQVLEKIFVPNCRYLKAGLTAIDLTSKVSRDFLQANLFEKGGEVAQKVQTKKNEQLSEALDFIHRRFGSQSLVIGGCGLMPDWKVQCNMRSPAYTTNWNELLCVRI